MKDIFRISQLIIKDKLKTLSDKEKAELESLKGNYEFTKEVRVEDLVDKVSLYSELNKDKAWATILVKYQKLKSRRVFTLFNQSWHKYAAAAVIIGVLGSTYILKNNLFKPKTIDEEIPAIVNTEVIEPGTDKATLTLEDGSHVTLEKGTSFQTQNASSDGEVITYESRSSKSKEIKYNYLTIPRGGQYFVKLSDGTQVWLNSESQLKYPVSFRNGELRQVELVYGEAYFDVSPSTDHDGSKFMVINKNQEIEVLGTEFNIKAYNDELIVYTTLVEGKLEVKNAFSKQILAPNEQSQVNPNNTIITVGTVDVYSEISWKKGLFSFKGKPLKEIMVVLSRWYDFEVVFTDKDLENVKFNGVLSKNDNIEEILNVITNTNFINAYEINNKTITIK